MLRCRPQHSDLRSAWQACLRAARRVRPWTVRTRGCQCASLVEVLSGGNSMAGVLRLKSGEGASLLQRNRKGEAHGARTDAVRSERESRER